MLSQIRTIFGSEKLLRDAVGRESPFRTMGQIERAGCRGSLLTSSHNTFRFDERVSTPGEDPLAQSQPITVFDRNPF